MINNNQVSKITAFALLFVLLVILPACSFGNSNTNSSQISTPEKSSDFLNPPKFVSIKYRDGAVDLNNSRFQSLDTNGSSFVKGSWYDSENQYMIINLNNTYYHYCGVSDDLWKNFTRSESFGTFYNISFKGQYDCRNGYVPSYDKNELETPDESSVEPIISVPPITKSTTNKSSNDWNSPDYDADYEYYYDLYYNDDLEDLEYANSNAENDAEEDATYDLIQERLDELEYGHGDPYDEDYYDYQGEDYWDYNYGY